MVSLLYFKHICEMIDVGLIGDWLENQIRQEWNIQARSHIQGKDYRRLMELILVHRGRQLELITFDEMEGR